MPMSHRRRLLNSLKCCVWGFLRAVYRRIWISSILKNLSSKEILSFRIIMTRHSSGFRFFLERQWVIPGVRQTAWNEGHFSSSRLSIYTCRYVFWKLFYLIRRKVYINIHFFWGIVITSQFFLQFSSKIAVNDVRMLPKGSNWRALRVLSFAGFKKSVGKLNVVKLSWEYFFSEIFVRTIFSSLEKSLECPSVIVGHC